MRVSLAVVDVIFIVEILFPLGGGKFNLDFKRYIVREEVAWYVFAPFVCRDTAGTIGCAEGMLVWTMECGAYIAERVMDDGKLAFAALDALCGTLGHRLKVVRHGLDGSGGVGRTGK